MTTKESTNAALRTLGFTEEEIRIYLCLAENGLSTVTAISRKTKMSRPTCYSLLASLMKKGGVKKSKKGKSVVYQASDPDFLLSLFESAHAEGVRSLSSLALTYKNQNFIPEMTFYSGAENISKIYDDIAHTLPKGGTYFRYTSRNDETRRSPVYSRLRAEKEIERLVITSEKKKSTKSHDPNRFIKTVPRDFSFDDNVTAIIYGTKIAHIDFNSHSAIVIESPQLARFQEKLFKLLWRKL